jgi:hypothetical protein
MAGAVEWRKRTAFSAVILLAISAGSVFVSGNSLPLHQVQSQDLPILLVIGASVVLTAFWAPAWRLPARLPDGWVLLSFGTALAGLAVWGAYAVFSNYPLSRDETMVLFDMAVYDKGLLAMPLAPFWRPFASALVPDFLLHSSMPTGLVSAYLPINALLRLAFSKVADPAWFNPLLALAGGAALFDIARKLFRNDGRAIWVVLLVYTLSSQMLVTAMTPYAMTGHMALGLVWLAAFLRGGRAGNAVAILTAFLATGFHQLIFHPVFAAPFLLWRLRQGQVKLVLIYAAAYALIGLWWAYFPVLASAQSAPAMGASQYDNFITQRAAFLLSNRSSETVGFMVFNLLRFFAWQNLALLPLLVAAIPVAWRDRGIPGALLLGIVLWLAIVTLLLPYQGLGWGFRYLSPYLGSFALLAGFGYRDLADRIGARGDGMVIALSGATALIAMPLLIVSAHRFVQPYVALERLVAAQATPVVVIDTQIKLSTDRGWEEYPMDQVRNLPDLSNRPLRLSSLHLTAEKLAMLCSKGPVTLITRRDMHRVGFQLNVAEGSPEFEAKIRRAGEMASDCFRPANVSFTKVS